MARTMHTARRRADQDHQEPQKTKIDRAGSRVLERVVLVREGEPNSSLDFRKKFYSPRHEIVKELLEYLQKITERFPGMPSSTRRYKRFSDEDDVLKEVEYEELTRVGYSGHFAMKLLRDEFPTDFFALETTEMGPRLICTKIADSGFLRNSRRFFHETCETFGDSEEEVKVAVKDYVDKCRECDELVLEVCEACC